MQDASARLVWKAIHMVMDDEVLNSAASTTSHVDGIGMIMAAITAILGGTLELTNYATLQVLVQPPGDMERFSKMMAAVIMATVNAQICRCMLLLCNCGSYNNVTYCIQSYASDLVCV